MKTPPRRESNTRTLFRFGLVLFNQLEVLLDFWYWLWAALFLKTKCRATSKSRSLTLRSIPREPAQRRTTPHPVGPRGLLAGEEQFVLACGDLSFRVK